MNRFCKVLAVILAMLMMVTMATACKKSDSDDDFSAFLDNESSDSGFGDDDTNDDGNNDNVGDTNKEDDTKDPSDDKGGKEDDKKPGKDDKEDDKTPQNGVVNENPDADEKEQNKIVENYDGTQKYDFKNNPLLAESKKINHGEEPSFDLDTTGFVKNVKVADLKGKSLVAITSLEVANFIYRGPKGELLNEWTWFDSLKKTYGVKFTYVESRWDKAPALILNYMQAGKQLDIIPTHRSGLAQLMNLSQPLNPYINTKYINNSPGIDTRTMEQSKRYDGYRCIAPIGAVDVIWYNETMTKSLGLSDPYTLWKQDKWDWEAFRNYMVSVPVNAPNGNTKLRPFFQSAGDSIFFWPRTNGVSVFEFKNEANGTKIISNFDDDRCLAAWTFFSDLMNQIQCRERHNNEGSDDAGDGMFTKGAGIMGCTLYLMRDWSTSDYAKSQKYRWVPYPKGPDKDGECVAMNYGNTMMLPKKMAKQSNIPYAIKVMEIWANRFTEALYDYLQEPYFNFTYAERVEFFNFVSQHNYFNPAGGWRNLLTGDDYTHYKEFEKSFYDNTTYNTTTAAKKVSNLINKAVDLMQKYGD